MGRVAGKALQDYAEKQNEELLSYSMYDPEGCETAPYLPKKYSRGFGNRKIQFVAASVIAGRKSRVVVLCHVKLLIAGYLIKLFSKNTKVILIAHGKEVWEPLSTRQQSLLKTCDLILPVSRFTREKLKTLYHIPDEKLLVLHNCLDPYLPKPVPEGRRMVWREKYNIPHDAFLLMTLSRLTIHEKNKGYDKALVSISQLLPQYPRLYYLFVGRYDDDEKQRLDALIAELGITGRIIFSGFVADEALADHYNMCDVYIMPSEKEGFGISFIEALYYGRPVIAGNRDGSTDALLDGKLGVLVDPRSQEAITGAIRKVYENPAAFKPDRELLMEHFSFERYREEWGKVLDGCR